MNENYQTDNDENAVWVFKEVDDRLSSQALVLSAAACGAPLVYAGLAMYQVVPIHWNAMWPILACFFGGGTLAITALVVSLITRSRYRSRKSLVAILLSVLAFPAVLFASYLVAMFSIATHPV